MATISTLDKAGTTHPSRFANKKVPYVVEFVLDYAKALAAKGSALAASDVIEVIDLPAGTVVLDAGAEILVAGDSTTLTLNVGTGADADEWVAGLDGKSTAGTWAPDLDSSPVINTYPTADTIDVVFATLTGTLTSGKVRVYALVVDASKSPGNPGIAALKS